MLIYISSTKTTYKSIDIAVFLKFCFKMENNLFVNVANKRRLNQLSELFV